MKILKMFALLLVMGFAFSACNEPAESYDADDKRLEDTRTPERETPREETDDNSMEIDVNVDKDGKVSGGGKVKVDDDKN